MTTLDKPTTTIPPTTFLVSIVCVRTADLRQIPFSAHTKSTEEYIRKTLQGFHLPSSEYPCLRRLFPFNKNVLIGLQRETSSRNDATTIFKCVSGRDSLRVG